MFPLIPLGRIRVQSITSNDARIILWIYLAEMGLFKLKTSTTSVVCEEWFYDFIIAGSRRFMLEYTQHWHDSSRSKCYLRCMKYRYILYTRTVAEFVVIFWWILKQAGLHKSISTTDILTVETLQCVYSGRSQRVPYITHIQNHPVSSVYRAVLVSNQLSQVVLYGVVHGHPLLGSLHQFEH